MRFIRPIPAAATTIRGGSRKAIKPQWLREWIADQPLFSLLMCGHKKDLHERYAIVVKVFGKSHVKVFCEKCEAFTLVKRRLTLLEYHGIEPYITPEEPLF